MDPARTFATAFRLFDGGVGGPPADDTPTIDATSAPQPPASAGLPAPLALPPSATPSTAGPRYDLRGLLGRGGMGEVRLAHDTRVGRDVAVKIAHARASSTPELRARFLREALVQGQLEHPAIVPVYDVEVFDDGVAYFSMKRVRGTTLATLLADARRDDHDGAPRPSLRRLLAALSSVCLAVEFAHEKGVVHRDIKPANVMVGDFGEVYLLDWGLAKIVGHEDVGDGGVVPAIPDDAATLAGSVLGTPGYMAPEQIDGSLGDVGPAVDVYALGAVLFEIVAGVRFIDAKTATDATIATLSGAERRPSVRSTGVVDAFDDVCTRALDRNPAARPRARAIHEAIDAYLAGESDRERRRALAREHLEQSRQHDDSVDGRARALRSLGSAIALDPENAEAKDALLRLLTTPPSTTPPEVGKQVDDDDERRVRQLANLRIISMAFYAPFVCALLWLGVRNTGAFIALVTGVVGAGVLNAWLARRPSPSLGVALVAQVSYLVATFGVMHYGGPLLLVPAILVGFSAQSQLHPRQIFRRVSLVITVLFFGACFLLERLGSLGRSYELHDGTLLVEPDLAPLNDVGLFFVFLASLATLASSSLFVARTRGELAAAEAKLHLQAWQLSQLASSSTTQPAPPRAAQPDAPV
jgi:serine/threonine-protein kinase